MQFRELHRDEIECRISTINEKGLSLLLYKDARCDMNILDEVVGSENWQRTHEVVNGNLFCNLGININYAVPSKPAEWVWKQDVGTESYTEKEKGQASDSFKRACFNWGIGRELYTAPFIWINVSDCNIKEVKGKKVCYDKFYVEDIAYENKKIVALSIKNRSTSRRVFFVDNRAKAKGA